MESLLAIIELGFQEKISTESLLNLIHYGLFRFASLSAISKDANGYIKKSLTFSLTSMVIQSKRTFLLMDLNFLWLMQNIMNVAFFPNYWQEKLSFLDTILVYSKWRQQRQQLLEPFYWENMEYLLHIHCKHQMAASMISKQIKMCLLRLKNGY